MLIIDAYLGDQEAKSFYFCHRDSRKQTVFMKLILCSSKCQIKHNYFRNPNYLARFINLFMLCAYADNWCIFVVEKANTARSTFYVLFPSLFK